MTAHRDAEGNRPWPVSRHLEVPALNADAEPVARRNHHRGRPDLYLQLDRHAGDERLELVMRMPRPAGQARSASVLRCDARSQPNPTQPCGSWPLTKVTSRPDGSVTRKVRKRSASVVDDATVRRAADRPGDLSVRLEAAVSRTPGPRPARRTRRCAVRYQVGRRVADGRCRDGTSSTACAVAASWFRHAQ